MTSLKAEARGSDIVFESVDSCTLCKILVLIWCETEDANILIKAWLNLTAIAATIVSYMYAKNMTPSDIQCTLCCNSL